MDRQRRVRVGSGPLALGSGPLYRCGGAGDHGEHESDRSRQEQRSQAARRAALAGDDHLVVDAALLHVLAFSRREQLGAGVDQIERGGEASTAAQLVAITTPDRPALGGVAQHPKRAQRVAILGQPDSETRPCREERFMRDLDRRLTSRRVTIEGNKTMASERLDNVARHVRQLGHPRPAAGVGPAVAE